MIDPCILTTPAFKVIEEDFKSVNREGLTYICDVCQKIQFQKNGIKLNALKYQTDIYNKVLLVNQIGYAEVAPSLC